MRARRLGLTLAGVVLGVLVFSVAPAFAVTGYGLSASFDAGQNVGPTPVGLAVDDSSSSSAGDVYVTDGEVVNRYTAAEAAAGATTPTLAPLTKFGYAYGVAVDPSNGDVYVADNAGTVHKFSASGAPISFSLSGATVAVPLGIAVNPANGNVLVGDGATNTVFEFSSTGVFTGKEYVVAVAAPAGIAVNGSGDVFVAAQGTGTLKFTAPGAVSEAFETSDANGVAVDGAGDVFVAGGGQVAEYDSTGKQVGQSFGTGVLAEAYGVGLSTAAAPLVYAADNAADDASVFDTGETPEAPLTEATTGVTSTTATLGGEVAGTGTGKATYDFAYNTNGSCVEGSTTTPVVAAPHLKVSSALTELAPGTQYTFCLVVTNGYGSATGAPVSFTTSVVVENESVVNDTATSAELQAEVATGAVGGPETTYRFEYGTSEAYGSSTPESLPLVGEHVASARVQGLQSSTTYHYRVVLTNTHTHVEIDGPDRVFSTQAVGGPLRMLDGREWEMVSPPNKHGSSIEGFPFEAAVMQAAEDGGAFTYTASGPVTSDPVGSRAPEAVQVFSRRGAHGWETQDIGTENNREEAVEVGKGWEYRVFSPDLSYGLVEPRTTAPLSPEASENELTLYRRDDAIGSYLPLVTGANVPPSTPFGELQFRAASSDLAHVVFSSPSALTPEVATNTGTRNLFEWTAGKLSLVSVLPNGRPATEPGGGEVGGSAEVGGEDSLMARDVVSNDGSRIVWEGEIHPERHLYLTDMAARETVQLDVPEQGAPGGTEEPAYEGASSDGSRIFFNDPNRLTSGAHYHDLYVAEVVAGRPHLEVTLTDLTEKTENGEPATVKKDIIGYSRDGSSVYFVTDGALTADAGGGSCSSNGAGEQTGECTLYLDHYDGTGWTLTKIARLSGVDRGDWGGGGGGTTHLAARVSPNGQFVAFMSQRSLTGYDNRDVVSGMPDQEVYLYDAVSKRLVCTSCNPTGARPVGVHDTDSPTNIPELLIDQREWYTGLWLAGSLPGWTPTVSNRALYQSRYLSDSGRLFFDGADALVPQDINGLEDVYEFEPEGVGDCGGVGTPGWTQTSGGCVGLISSGSSAGESEFLDASESGDDVFFMTNSRLVSADYDDAYDVYDAHVCGATETSVSAVGCEAPVAESPACVSADACRAAVSSQPGVFGMPPSETFSGAGNVSSTSTVGAGSPRGGVLTRAQKLAAALRVCAKRAKRKRESCRVAARRRYGAKAAAGTTSERRGK